MSNCSPSLSASEKASLAATIASSFDISLPLYRNTPGVDNSGHAVPNYVPYSTLACNVIHPSATVLQLYASKIGSQRALTLRTAQNADVKEGDRVQYDGLPWMVQNMLDAQSFSFTKRYLITTIAPVGM